MDQERNGNPDRHLQETGKSLSVEREPFEEKDDKDESKV
jgi:hypothetical protein